MHKLPHTIGLAVALLTVVEASALADVIRTRTREITGTIVRVEGDSIVVRLEAGEIRVPRAEVVGVTVNQPPEVVAGFNALKVGQFREAVAALKPIVDRYGGLPVPWVEEAALRIGDAYLGLKDDVRARSSYEAFAKLYPQSAAAPALSVKTARLLQRQGKHAEALGVTQAFLDPLLKKEPLTEAQKAAVAEALVVQGDSLAATGQLAQALDSYLLVVTLFDSVETITAEATLKAGQMFEQLKNIKRARDLYEDVARLFPQSEFVKPAQARLAALAGVK